MKRTIFSFLLALEILTAHGQMIFLETGKLLGNFNYKNSTGISSIPYTGTIQNNLGIGFRQSLFTTPLHFSVEALYDKYFIQGSDKVLGNFYEYNLNCLGTELGLDFEFLRPELGYNERHGFSFSLSASAMADVLMKGSQRINDNIIDLRGKEEFDKPAMVLKGGAMLNYYLSKNYMVFARYRYGHGILIGNYDNQEQLRYITHSITAGIMIILTYRN